MTDDSRPWFRQPLLWLTVSPLVVTVIAGTWLIVTTTQLGGVDALPGEYAKTGKLVALDEAALRRSATLAADARGLLDREGQVLRVDLTLPERPGSLAADLIHATLPEQDLSLTLDWDGESWRVDLPEQVPSRGELHVYPPDRAWRLVAAFSESRALAFEPSRR